MNNVFELLGGGQIRHDPEFAKRLIRAETAIARLAKLIAKASEEAIELNAALADLESISPEDARNLFATARAELARLPWSKR